MSRPILIVLFCLALLPAGWLAWLGRDLPHLGSFHDDGVYLEAARGLAAGDGYRIGSLPLRPAQTKYPPGYPLYLSLAWRIGSDLDTVLPWALLLTWLWLPVWAYALYQLGLRLGWTPAISLAWAAATVLHPESQLAATRLMSDLPGAALLTLSLLTFPGPASLATAVLAFVFRTAALPLLAAQCVEQTLCRRWRSLFTILVTAILAAGAWFAWTGSVRAPAPNLAAKYYCDYLGYQFALVPWAQLPAHMGSQIAPLLDTLARLLLVDGISGVTGAAVRLLVLVAAASGIRRLFAPGPLRLYTLYSIAALVLGLFWYFPPDSRTLLPVLPLVLAGLGRECGALFLLLRASFRKSLADRLVAAAISLLLLLLALTVLGRGEQLWRTNGADVFALERGFQPGLRDAYAFIRHELPLTTTLFTVNDPATFLQTGRPTLRFPLTGRIYTRDAAGVFHPSADTLATMRDFALDCLFVSKQHFDPDPLAPYAPLRFSLAGTGLEERYRSRTELIACRP